MLLVRGRIRRLFAALTRTERAVLALFALFCVKFVFSTAAHFLPALQGVDLIGSGGRFDFWLLLLCWTALLGLWCLYRRALRSLGVQFNKFELALLAVACAASAAFYLHAMLGRHVLYIWDNATYYNLQLRLGSNFSEGVFQGVGATVYKTWFNDYAPLVINLLLQPFFVLTDRTANSFAMTAAMLFPPLVYLGALTLLSVLKKRLAVRCPRAFVGLGMAFTVLFPLLHFAMYRGMPDLLGVGFALMLLALSSGYEFRQPAAARLVCMTAFTAMLIVTRRSYMFWVVVFFVLYGLWVLGQAAHRRDGAAALRLLRFAVGSLAVVGVPLLPMFYNIISKNYAERYVYYMSGGFWEELLHQKNYLGWLLLAVMVLGGVYGLLRSNTRLEGLLVLLGSPAALWLITRVQNISDHQSLALVPFYLLGFYLFAAALAMTKPPAASTAAVVLSVFCVLNFGKSAGWIPTVLPQSVTSGGGFWMDGEREDFDQIQQVNDWLRENCTGKNSAYMICHGTVYSPDLFRAMALPDQTIRDILPYGAFDPGNDTFPVELFDAQVVLTCIPFENQRHTPKINAAFLENQRTLGHFEMVKEFDMGNGYTIQAYRRIQPVNRAELETYREYLKEEDAQFPYNFSQVLDAYAERNGL